MTLSIQAETAFRGLTPSGLARIDVTVGDQPAQRVLMDWSADKAQIHRDALLYILMEGFSVRKVRETRHGYVWQITSARKGD